ncbi:hypothetical protein ACKUB1_11690 [Methanospirillum stamsii]|uniref:SF3 helicase domain-containing protein n=1 Tax=Methanospirillum stamsii TaxID=1277351 RepID=A0A2V2MYF0_9EURY|nr:hypothetical protein [Methanospirillum stamsii]PWR73154.1 hypothetical protein DLD82_11300 [Methanospirillum stamsii]
MTGEEHIKTGLSVLFSPGQVVELRSLGDHTRYGYYTDMDRLARDAAVIDNMPGISGIYVTLNQVNPALLSRCANRIKTAGKKEPQTGDGDITNRCWLPIDIDPLRPSGISSSDKEHTAALNRAEIIRDYLFGLGFPDPVMADSGNGAHLLYRIDLPNDPESSDIVKGCLKTLDLFFSDTDCAVDTSVFNPSRIWKLYGTRSRKGDHTDERPHRVSEIIHVPEAMSVVPVSSLIQLASQLQTDTTDKRPAEGMSSSGKPDLAAWLTRYGLSYTEKPYQVGRLFIFDQCPFSNAHKDGAYAIQFANGAIFTGCHHNSCGGNTQRWHELRGRFEPQKEEPKPKRDFESWKKRQIRDRACAKAERDGMPEKTGNSLDTAMQATIPLTTGDPNIHDEAIRILREGDPIRYILDIFTRMHEGDEIVARCLLMSLASRLVVNSNGLHVLVTGESGKGKSHAFETMLDLIPQQFRLSGGLSNKGLFYTHEIRKGMVICLDDVSLSEQMQETLKGVTSSFHKPFIYRTVDKDRNGITKVIPERCLWWVAKVEGSGDEQVWNRMLTVWIDDSQQQDDKVLAKKLTAAAKPASRAREFEHEISVCQEIWNNIREVSVIIPYAENIRFSSSKNRRNPTMLLDLIRSVAAFRQYQRRYEDGNGFIEISATKEDFKKAVDIYHLLNGVSGAQMTKLTRSESVLIDAIRNSGKTVFTVKDLQDLVSRAHSTITRMLYGRGPNGTHHTGLLEKCPQLSVYDRSETLEEGMYKRGKVYTWDFDMDRIWSCGGSCWLDEPDSHEDDDGPDDNSDGNSDNCSDDGSSNYSDDSPDNVQMCTHVHGMCREKCTFNQNDMESAPENTCDAEYSGTNVHSGPGAIEDQDDRIVPSIAPENYAHTYSNNSKMCCFEKLSDDCTETNVHSVMHNGCTSVHTVHIPSGPPPGSDTKSKKLRYQDINPARFVRTDEVLTRKCDCCGKRRGTYKERGNPGGPVICDRCYSRVVSRKVMTFTALPGVLPLSGMKKTNRSLGRCSLCNLKEITWWDEETKTGLCDSCFQRERVFTPISGGV